MAGILVVAENSGGKFRRVSLETLSKARDLKGSIGGPLAAVVTGSGVAGNAGDLGAYGAEKVFVADNEALGTGLAAPHVDVIAKIQEDNGFDAILVGGTALGRDIAAALAARLGAGLNSDSTDLAANGSALRATRPAFGGQNLVECEWNGTPQIAVVRPNSFQATESGGSAEVVTVTPEISDAALAAKMTGRKPAEEGASEAEKA